MWSGAPDVPAWWSRAGNPAWTPDADWGTTFPFTLAGHVRGGWTLHEPARAEALEPYPGVIGARSPIAWFDSVTVGGGPGAAWRGWQATLIDLSGDRGPAARPARATPRAIGDFTFVNGTSGFEEYALGVQRGDSLAWLRGESSSWERGGVGSMADAGRHMWGGSLGVTRGMHTVGGALAQRGHAERLLSGEEQSVAGGGGHAWWRVQREGQAVALRAERSQDALEGFGGSLDFQRRESEREALELSWRGGVAATPLEARVEYGRERVITFDAADTARAMLDADAWWAAVRGDRRLGDGRLELGVGVGRHEGVDRLEIAPTVAYAFTTPVFDGRLTVERVLAPVWTDLAPGQGPFLQSTWSAGLEIGASKPLLGAARVAWRMGRTRDRAVASRAPLEAVWLRDGFRLDPRRYDFGLLTAATAWDGRWGGAGLEGFVLARRDTPAQPRVDPGQGGRAWIEGRGRRFFAGDLGVTLRLEAAAVGERESEASPSRRLPAYVTLGASVVITLADAVVTIRALNLEDEPRPMTWLDPTTGLEALGAGRESVFSLTWRLFN